MKDLEFMGRAERGIRQLKSLSLVHAGQSFFFSPHIDREWHISLTYKFPSRCQKHLEYKLCLILVFYIIYNLF